MPLSALEEPFSAPSFPTPSLLARRAPQWKWNPYTDTPLPSLLTSGLTAEEGMSIPALVEKYEQQVAALLRTHEDIMFVKGRVHNALNELRSFAGNPTDASGARDEENRSLQLAERSSELAFLKQGLDIRLRQFDEDCQSASKLEWILRRKLSIAEDTQKSLQTVQPFQVQPTCEALKKIEDQDRLIKLLQHVLDQNVYHNYTFAEQLRWMRRECFAEELEISGTIREASSWFEGKAIQFNVKKDPQVVSSWLKMIRRHPTKKEIPPPPRADPQSLCFVAKVHEIDQLASAIAEEGGKVATFRRKQDFKELLGQLSKLRNVLEGAAAAAKGTEKIILNGLTTQVDKQINYASGVSAQAVATEGVSDRKSTQAVRLTKPHADDGKGQAPFRPRASTLPERKETHEAPSLAEVRKGSSRSSLQKGPIRLPSSSGHVLLRTSSRTLASPRKSHTSMLDVQTEKPDSVTVGVREDMLTKREPSLSLPAFSAPRSTPPLRGESRTVPSPRQSFSEEVPRIQDGWRKEFTRKPTEELPVQPPTGAEQRNRGDRHERRSAYFSAPVGGMLTRAGSRTVPSPRKTLSRSSLTLRSPREQQTPVSPTSLSRAMSSAFLGS